VLLLATTLAVFLQTTAFAFVWDDHLLVVENQLTTSFEGVLAAFSSDLWASTGDPDPSSGFYRPLFVVDLGITRALAGLHPGAHHLHGLLWHMLAIALAGRLLATIVRNGWAVGTGLALFALHPVQAESVGFVSARNDPMAAAFLLGALLLLTRNRPSGGAVVGGAMLVLAAALAKESVALAPLLLALVCRARSGTWGSPAAHLSTIAGLALAIGLRLGAGVTIPAQADLPHLTAAGWPTVVHSLARLAWPVDLAPLVHLGWPPALPTAAAGVAAAAIVCLALLGGRPARLGAAFAVVAAAPALAGVANTGAIVDRYMYLPMFGLALALAAVVARLPLPRPAYTAAVGGLALLTIAQLQVWKTDATLWGAAMRHAPSGYAAGALARFLEDDGRPRAAANWYRRAVRMAPRPFEPACFNITRVHLSLGDPSAAVGAGREALLAGCSESPELMAPLSVALAATGDWPSAERMANRIGQDPTGKAIVVRIAAQSRLGNLGPLRAATEAAGGQEAVQLVGQVVWLVRRSGDDKGAAAIQAAFR
jgi:hypothetical protein